MDDTLKCTFLVGSLRSGSLNRAAAVHARSFLGDDADVTTPDLGKIPLYNQDLEENGSLEVVTELQSEVARSDIVVIFSPEYNYGIPGPLKNAIDWLSRPFGAGSLIGRAVGIVSVSPSSRGGENVREQLLQTCEILSDRTCGITLGIGGVASLNEGALPHEGKQALDGWLEMFTRYAAGQRPS